MAAPASPQQPRTTQRAGALAYVYYEEEPGRRSVAHLHTHDEARRIAANIANPSRLASCNEIA